MACPTEYPCSRMGQEDSVAKLALGIVLGILIIAGHHFTRQKWLMPDDGRSLTRARNQVARTLPYVFGLILIASCIYSLAALH